MNQISRPWDTTAAPLSKESEKPQNQQNNDEYFEHMTSSFNTGRAASVPTEDVPVPRSVNLNSRRSIHSIHHSGLKRVASHSRSPDLLRRQF